MYSFIGHRTTASKASSANYHSHPSSLTRLAVVPAIRKANLWLNPSRTFSITHVTEAQLLSQMDEKVNQSERCYEIRHLLLPCVLKDTNVRIKIPHYNRFPPREKVERILKIRNVINSEQGYVQSDERGLLCDRNNSAAHHVCPIEAHGFNYPSLWPLPSDQAQSLLRSPIRSDYLLGAHNFLPQAFVSVNLVRNLHLRQKYQVVFTKMHGTDGLG